jgi:hypothetical protein
LFAVVLSAGDLPTFDVLSGHAALVQRHRGLIADLLEFDFFDLDLGRLTALVHVPSDMIVGVPFPILDLDFTLVSKIQRLAFDSIELQKHLGHDIPLKIFVRGRSP